MTYAIIKNIPIPIIIKPSAHDWGYLIDASQNNMILRYFIWRFTTYIYRKTVKSVKTFHRFFGARGWTWTGTNSRSRDFKAYASKITTIQNNKNKGIFSQKHAKNAPKSIIYLFFIPYPFVTNSLKSATSQNFPTFFTKTPW